MGFFLLPPAEVSYISEWRGKRGGAVEGGVWGQGEGGWREEGAEAVKKKITQRLNFTRTP